MPSARSLCGGRRKLLYLGFEDRLDPVVALAVERMSGLRVESGLVAESLFGPAHTRMLKAKFPRGVDRGQFGAGAGAQAGQVDRTVAPVASRLVRVHDCLWLRMWRTPQSGPMPERDSIEDLIGSIGAQ